MERYESIRARMKLLIERSQNNASILPNPTDRTNAETEITTPSRSAVEPLTPLPAPCPSPTKEDLSINMESLPSPGPSRDEDTRAHLPLLVVPPSPLFPGCNMDINIVPFPELDLNDTVPANEASEGSLDSTIHCNMHCTHYICRGIRYKQRHMGRPLNIPCRCTETRRRQKEATEPKIPRLTITALSAAWKEVSNSDMVFDSTAKICIRAVECVKILELVYSKRKYNEPVRWTGTLVNGLKRYFKSHCDQRQVTPEVLRAELEIETLFTLFNILKTDQPEAWKKAGRKMPWILIARKASKEARWQGWRRSWNGTVEQVIQLLLWRDRSIQLLREQNGQH